MYPSVTYTFSNGTKADGTEVNTNFQDLINALSLGNRDIVLDDIKCNTLTVASSLVSPSTTLSYANLIVSSTQPSIFFRDTNATAGDNNAVIYVNATDVGDGTEDIDVAFQQQIAGTLTTWMYSDADGSITLGNSGRHVVLGGELSLTGYASTYDVITTIDGINIRISAGPTGGDTYNGSYLVLNNSAAGGAGGDGDIELFAGEPGDIDLYHGANGGDINFRKSDGTIINTFDNDGQLTLGSISAGVSDYDKFLVADTGIVKYRTGAQVLSDIGGIAATSISGTENYIAKFGSGGNNIGDSLISQSGTTITAGGNFVIGLGTAGTDYTLTFNGETNDGLITWMEDEDQFLYADTINVNNGANTTSRYLGSLTNLAHGITDYLPTDAFLKIAPASATGGGAVITAATEQDVSDSSPFTFRGILGLICNDGTFEPAFVFDGGTKDGTGYTALGSSTDIAQFKNAGTEKASIEYDGSFNTAEVYKVDGTQVVGNRVIDARISDTPNSGDATTDGLIDAIRDAMISHGLIAAS